jgi:hypothetical protein
MSAGREVTIEDPAPPEPASSTRPIELALARAHLRLGSLALARAELEILARDGVLDTLGQVDLAEARWRTGDLSSAGEAAAIALGAGEDEPVALTVAAEAAAALGRPNEARRLANLALERVSGPIDAVFAGMPRSAVWPADAAELPPSAGTLFHQEPASARDRRAGDTDPGIAASRAAGSEDRSAGESGAPMTLGFWDGDRRSSVAAPPLPDPAGELEAARAALVTGSLEEATLRLALVLRQAPALAPAILEATDGIPGPAVNLVRGDAYRLVGLESEAQRAYAAATWSGTRDRRSRASRAKRAAATDDRPRTADAGAPEAADSGVESMPPVSEPGPPDDPSVPGT